MGRVARIGILAVACLAVAACSGSFPGTDSSKRVYEDGEPIPKGGGTYKVGQPYSVKGRTYYPSEDPAYRAEGLASWYGPDFHGRETANGEFYDMHAITAAHPTLPIPSYARVTNLENGASIIVRVNDRGPFFGGRIVDLSIGAAKALDFYSKGLTRVRVEYVGRAPIEGNEDQILLATLRHGTPAPVPSRVVLASAKSSPASAAERRPEPKVVQTVRDVDVTGSASKRRASSAAAAAAAPARSEDLALMSGRGLY